MKTKLFPDISNRRIRHEAITVYKYFLADDGTREEVKKHYPDGDYEQIVKNSVEFAFYYPGEVDCFNPYTDKEYLDVSWMRVGNRLIDLDEIYALIINEAEQLAEELK